MVMEMTLENMDKALVDSLVRIEGILNMMRQGSSQIVIYEKIQGLRDRLNQSLKEVRADIVENILRDQSEKDKAEKNEVNKDE